MLIQLTLCNFKSYLGTHQVGPFNDFCAIIGPNGSGKSNLLDAVSFLLAVKTKRHVNLATFVNSNSTSAFVSCLYRSDNVDSTFKREIVNNSSVFSLNGKVVSYAVYAKALENENILVKARNFLVFQGDVEQVASQSPKDLTHLIEQISGSLALKSEYDRLKLLQDEATAVSVVNLNKKRGVNAEIKMVKEGKEGVKKWEKLQKQKVSKTNNRLKCWKLTTLGNCIISKNQ